MNLWVSKLTYFRKNTVKHIVHNLNQQKGITKSLSRHSHYNKKFFHLNSTILAQPITWTSKYPYSIFLKSSMQSTHSSSTTFIHSNNSRTRNILFIHSTRNKLALPSFIYIIFYLKLPFKTLLLCLLLTLNEGVCLIVFDTIT